MYGVLIKALTPVVALLAAGVVALTPAAGPAAGPGFDVVVTEARQTPKGAALRGQIRPKSPASKQPAPPLDFEAIIDNLTHQPGQLTRITIRNDRGQVTAEYWHPAPAAPPAELANSPTDMHALRMVYRWYKSQPRAGEWLRSLFQRGKSNEQPPQR